MRCLKVQIPVPIDFNRGSCVTTGVPQLCAKPGGTCRGVSHSLEVPPEAPRSIKTCVSVALFYIFLPWRIWLPYVPPDHPLHCGFLEDNVSTLFNLVFPSPTLRVEHVSALKELIEWMNERMNIYTKCFRNSGEEVLFCTPIFKAEFFYSYVFFTHPWKISGI